MENRQTTNRSNQWLWIGAAIIGLLVLACICLAALGVIGMAAGLVAYNAGQTDVLTDLDLFDSPTATPPAPITPFPTVAITPLPPDTPGSGEAAQPFDSELPPRDRYDLARRFLGVGEVEPPQPKTYQVGDVETFWVDNDDTETTLEVDAELVYMNERVYMWVEQGVRYDYDALVESADLFAEKTYPTNHAFFGSEASPGIDGDERLHVLHSTELGSTVAGYFFSPSEYPASVVPYSNEKEIFFVNISNTPPGDFYYDATLAHEFQHMIHWHVDQNEESWMNEGMSEVAAFLNDFGPSDWTSTFLINPDLQLTGWPEDGSGANYGAAFLFNTYFLDRFGQDALRALVANPLNGMTGVEDTLAQVNAGVTADEVFADWTVANLVNDPAVGQGQYAYQRLPDLFAPTVFGTVSTFPYETGWEQVHQYGTDYIQVTGVGEVTLTFEGAPQVRVLPADTYDTDGDASTEDRFVWWSNRGDDSDMTLTRPVDLTTASQPMLEYDVWYAIEEGWDYAYLTVSTDGGETWTILPTPHTTTSNPHGNSYGPGYSGNSSDRPGADAEGWLHEGVDLSDYAGQEILLRFEMITDDAVNQPGLAVDNLRIEETGWYDDAEAGDADWEAHGFVRHNNVLRQVFSVQVVVPDGSGGLDVQRLELDENNQGTLTFPLDSSRPATLVISGLTRFTTEPALYRYTLTPGGE